VKVSRRRLHPAETRRLFELTLRAGASLREIARELGLRPNILRQWRVLHRAGKPESPAHVGTDLTIAALVPVSIVPTARRLRLIARPNSSFGPRVKGMHPGTSKRPLAGPPINLTIR